METATHTFLSAKAFARELSVSPLTIAAAIRAGRIPGAEDRGAGARPRYRIPHAALEYVRENLQCSYPDCPKVAPGPSGRCGDHPARGESHLLPCEGCGQKRVIPVSRVRQGRGKYCSECWPSVQRARAAELAPTANPDGARAHHAAIAAKLPQLEVEGLLTPARAAEDAGVQPFWLKWGYHYNGDLPGEIHHFDGSSRLLFRTDDVDRFLREYVRGGDGRRRSWFDPNHVVRRLHGRGLVHTLDDATAVRAAVLDRRKLLRRRAGRPKAPEVGERLFMAASEIIADELATSNPVDLSQALILGMAIIQDSQGHPDIWRKWMRNDGEIDPVLMPAAVDAARKRLGQERLKRLQIAWKK